MRRSRPFRRVDIVVAGVVVFCFLGPPAVSWAGVAGSKHDFTITNGTSLNTGGTCTPCHSPHFAPAVPGIWARGLSEERGSPGFTQASVPNYIPGATLLCYDCHENSATAADDSPPVSTTWSSGHAPQDIAFNGTAVGYYETACGQLPAAGNLPVAGTPTGGHYWKTEPGLTPNYALGDKIACSLCHDPHDEKTGAAGSKNDAFFRTETWDGDSIEPLDGVAGFTYPLRKSKNSRVPDGTDTRLTGREMCATCHGFSDTGTRKIFFNVTATLPPASPIVLEHGSTNATACTDCHGHNQIAGCNACHGYPPLLTQAEGGGTFNPNDTGNPNRRYVENYVGGAGAHRRHLDALLAIGSTIFNCAICHGPNPGRPGTAWHNESCSDWSTNGASVDIMGQVAYWGAAGGSTPPGYNTTTTGEFTGSDGIAYAFAAKGGGARRCSNLACHGFPPNAANDVDALNWDDRMVYDTIDANAGNWIAPAGDSPKICKWCHDATPARIGTGPGAPNVLGTDDGGATGVWNSATNFWGADVSGHGKASGFYDDNQVGTAGALPAANMSCDVCHDARYTTLSIPAPPLPYVPNTARRTHFDAAYNSAEKRLKGTNNTTINGVATLDADAACNACHQNGAPAPLAGRFVSTHGNDFPEKSVPGPDFTRSCRQCHNVHGANWNGLSGAAPNLGRNLHMIGKWVDSTTTGTRGVADAGEEARVDSNAINELITSTITASDLPVVFTTNSGENSYDDGFGGPESPAAHESVCVVCHVTLAAAHANGSSDNTVGSLRTRAEANTHSPIGGDCTDCHKHNADTDVLTADAFAPSACFACHGTNDTETLVVGAVRRQFWPDGSPRTGLPPQYVYADNQAGAHKKHVAGIAWQVFGETEAQLVTDVGNGTGNGPSVDKQKTICWFCHFDPGGPGHSNGTFESPAGTKRVNVFQGAAERDYFGKFVDALGATPPTFRYGARTVLSRSTKAPAASGGDPTGGGYSYGTESCATLVCHNQTATPVLPGGWNAPPTWAPTNVACSNIACHTTATYTVAHAPHVNGTLALGQPKSYFCTECHADNYTVVPAINPIPLAHGNGGVNMKFDNAGSLEGAHGGDGFYDKDAIVVPAAPVPTVGDTGFAYKSGAYARCWLVYCHGGDNDGNLPTSVPDWGGITTSPSPAWDAAGPLACFTCHGAAPPTGRHIAHDNNDAWVPLECGACHTANNNKTSMAGTPQATHVNGSVNLGGNATIFTYNTGTGVCTNSCHAVAAATGDWIDANPLACTDCHNATDIGTAPTSGLHEATTAMAHDVQFPASQAELPPAPPAAATGTCTHCHLSTGPSDSHVTGPTNLATPENSTVAIYHFNSSYIPNAPAGSGYVSTQYLLGATTCQATCHSDYRVSTATGSLDTGGLWRRRWIGVVKAKPAAADNPGDPVCKNCHGDFDIDIVGTNGWNFDVINANTSTTIHTNPYDQDPGPGNPDWMSRHSVCQTCHGWGYAGYDRAWGGVAPGHGDGSITMNGPAAPPAARAGAEYNDTSGGCAAACHSEAYVMNTNSGWPANYGDFGSGACELCHNSSPHPGCDEIPATEDDAPNVMGPGTNASGTGTPAKPYDDGAYGFNVNGHGANGGAVNRPTASLNPDRVCIDCHDITDPPNTHFYCPNPPPTPGVLNTRYYFGKTTDTRNTNTSHLVSGFLDGANTPQPKQIDFDDYCYDTCHVNPPAPATAQMDMRHSFLNGNLSNDKIMQFNTAYTTTDDPKQDRGADNVWTPWTIDDLTTVVDASPPTTRHHGVCVSCHDPHGTSTLQKSRLTNKMVIRNWQDTAMPTFCQSNCHKIP